MALKNKYDEDIKLGNVIYGDKVQKYVAPSTPTKVVIGNNTSPASTSAMMAQYNATKNITPSKTTTPIANNNLMVYANPTPNVEGARDLIRNVMDNVPSPSLVTDKSLADTALLVSEAIKENKKAEKTQKKPKTEEEKPATDTVTVVDDGSKPDKKPVPEDKPVVEDTPVVEDKPSPGETPTDNPSVVDNSNANAVPSTYEAFGMSETTANMLSNLQAELDKLKSGKTSFSDQFLEALNKYMNKESFSYNADADPMFQNYLQSAMDKGNIAMQDTMGQAAGLTGGYGSTYAQAVGNAAYNNYLNDAYANVTNYYNMALNNYNTEMDRLYNNAKILGEQDQQEWEKMYNSYNLALQNAKDSYNRDYDAWKSGYDMYRDSVTDSQWKAEQDRKLAADAEANKQWWANYEESVRQFNEGQKYKYDVFNADNTYRYDALNADNTYRYDALNADNDYRYAALKENARQFDSKAFSNEGASVASNRPAPITDSDETAMIKAYEKSGYSGVNNYIDTHPNLQTSEVADYMFNLIGSLGVPSGNYAERNWTVSDSKWIGDDILTDQYGNHFSAGDLIKAYKQQLLDMGYSEYDANKMVKEWQKNNFKS